MWKVAGRGFPRFSHAGVSHLKQCPGVGTFLAFSYHAEVLLAVDYHMVILSRVIPGSVKLKIRRRIAVIRRQVKPLAAIAENRASQAERIRVAPSSPESWRAPRSCSASLP
jgi:hypothetical protein